MSEAGTGLASAVDQALDRAGTMMFADPEQVELALEAAAKRDIFSVQEAVAEVRKAGRPKGAANKRTGKIRDFLLSQHRHPLHTLAMMQEQNPDVLAAQLDCSKLEAARVIVAAAAELAPYVEGKMPVTVDFRGEGHMTLHLGAVPVAGGDRVGGSGPLIDVAPPIAFASSEMQGNQGLAPSERKASE